MSPALTKNLRAWLIRRGPELGVYATYGLLALLMVPEVLLGERPLSHDHATHFARAWQFLHHQLPSGRLWDWSSLWFAGYPVNYHYPFLADVLVALIHGLTLTLLPLAFSYSAAVVLVHFLEGFSLYWVGRILGHRRVGFLAGLFLMTHLGGPMVGGWFWVHYVGVWPVSLSVSLSLIAFCLFHRLMEYPSPRRAAWLGIFWGLALLAHPLQQINLALMVPLMVASVGFLDRKQRGPRWKYLGLGLGIGAGLAALWTIPFIATSEFAERFADSWGSLPKLSAQAWEGKLFEGFWPPLGLLGLAGIVFFALSRQPALFVAGVSSLILIVTGSTTFFETLGLDRISEKFLYIQYHRFQMLLKPFWCLAAAFLLVKGLEMLWRGSQARQVGSRLALARPLSVAALALLVLTAGLAPSLRGNTYVKDLDLVYRRSQPAYDSVVAWLGEKERGESRFFRVAVFNHPDSSGSHELTDLVTRIRSPLYNLTYTPSVNFKHNISASDEEALQMMSVRYLVSDTPRHPLRGNPQVREVAAFKPYRIYEYEGWNPLRHHLVGKGAATEAVWEKCRFVLDVAPESQGMAVFHVAHFSRWKAYWNGRPVPMAPFPVLGQGEMVAVSLPDTAGGRLELRFELGLPEYLGLIGFFAALIVCLHLLKRTTRQTTAQAKPQGPEQSWADRVAQ